jgi:hypothetical protein
LEFRVTPHHLTVYEWKTDRLRVTLEHDNIANRLNSLDGIVVGPLLRSQCRRLQGGQQRTEMAAVPPYYFRPSTKIGWGSIDSLRWLLGECTRRRWETVGTTAFGEGKHADFLPLLTDFDGPYPSCIRIFYLEDSDFEDLKPVF